jgi:hypothetical protein
MCSHVCSRVSVYVGVYVPLCLRARGVYAIGMVHVGDFLLSIDGHEIGMREWVRKRDFALEKCFVFARFSLN